ncbi:MAG: Lar family restriction alleviation protein [Candidatus Riflebacteria bacterium]|nr:Lar family restriction alleviation protein [Candidatus Riflebacteria bacterium]
MTKLKNCPFCGKRDLSFLDWIEILPNKTIDDSFKLVGRILRCENCKIELKYRFITDIIGTVIPDKKRADDNLAKRWNKRAGRNSSVKEQNQCQLSFDDLF